MVPLFCRYGTANFPVSFFYAHKRPSPLFLYIPHKKPSFKPTNDQFIVASICWVQLNQPTLDFGWQCNYLPYLAEKIPFNLFNFNKSAKKLFMGVNNVHKNIWQCTTNVQTKHSNVRCRAVTSFRILVVSLPKNRAVFFTVSVNFKVCSTFQVSHHFTGQCEWLQFV